MLGFARECTCKAAATAWKAMAGQDRFASTKRKGTSSKIAQTKAAVSAPTMVYDDGKTQFFLGSAWNAIRAAKDEYDLVVNCCAESPPHHQGKTVWIKLDDTNDCDLKPETAAITEARERMHDLREDHDAVGPKKVLVHCFWGASRSVAVLILLLRVLCPDMDFDQLYDMIQGQRPTINISQTLETQTRWWIHHGILMPRTDDDGEAKRRPLGVVADGE